MNFCTSLRSHWRVLPAAARSRLPLYHLAHSPAGWVGVNEGPDALWLPGSSR